LLLASGRWLLMAAYWYPAEPSVSRAGCSLPTGTGTDTGCLLVRAEQPFLIAGHGVSLRQNKYKLI